MEPLAAEGRQRDFPLFTGDGGDGRRSLPLDEPRGPRGGPLELPALGLELEDGAVEVCDAVEVAVGVTVAVGVALKEEGKKRKKRRSERDSRAIDRCLLRKRIVLLPRFLAAPREHQIARDEVCHVGLFAHLVPGLEC